MTRLPRLKGRELIRILQTLGFEVVRSRGSHFLLRHEDGAQPPFPCIPARLWGLGCSAPSCEMWN
jgi:predicted RNA binding protein YcfA (HicA-like mRNA interferase family)